MFKTKKLLFINFFLQRSIPSQNASAMTFQTEWVPKMMKSYTGDFSNGTFQRDGHDLLSSLLNHLFYNFNFNKNSYISIRKVYYCWEIQTSSIFSLVVVVDLDSLKMNFRETESHIDSLVYKVTFLIAGIGFGVMIVGFM